MESKMQDLIQAGIDEQNQKAEAYRKVKQALIYASMRAECNCPENSKTGRVDYHSNCYRKDKAQYEEALKELQLLIK